ncbi:DUF2065 domain-containing protein [Dyella sp.]|uniref:DUF2065 domain-containing protein n=1 Tax=Dyella sp. TaxID=1869338 RepID=UPI002ED3D14B
MSHDLAAALCLVLVIEGLVLLAVPSGWQAMMREALKVAPARLRIFGAVAVAAGLVFLQFAR